MPAGLPRASAVLYTGAARVVHTAVSVLHGVQPPTVGNIAQRRGATSDAPPPPACVLGHTATTGGRPRATGHRHLLDLGGTYGDPETADPIQYDELRIEHDQGDMGIVVYNRVILLFATDSEPVKRIHQVCWLSPRWVVRQFESLPMLLVESRHNGQQRSCGACDDGRPVLSGDPTHPASRVSLHGSWPVRPAG